MPARTRRAILDTDAKGQQFLAQLIGTGKVAASARIRGERRSVVRWFRPLGSCHAALATAGARWPDSVATGRASRQHRVAWQGGGIVRPDPYICAVPLAFSCKQPSARGVFRSSASAASTARRARLWALLIWRGKRLQACRTSGRAPPAPDRAHSARSQVACGNGRRASA
jgi:hypothetical protein